MSPVLDFTQPSKNDPSEWEGLVHALTVTRAEPPDGKFDDWHLEYEIAHPWCCKEGEPHYTGVTEYTCELAYLEYEAGLACCLQYSGTPVTAPGFYLIRSWGRKITHWELSPEYDNGIGLVSAV